MIIEGIAFFKLQRSGQETEKKHIALFHAYIIFAIFVILPVLFPLLWIFWRTMITL